MPIARLPHVVGAAAQRGGGWATCLEVVAAHSAAGGRLHDVSIGLATALARANDATRAAALVASLQQAHQRLAKKARRRAGAALRLLECDRVQRKVRGTLEHLLPTAAPAAAGAAPPSPSPLPSLVRDDAVAAAERPTAFVAMRDAFLRGGWVAALAAYTSRRHWPPDGAPPRFEWDCGAYLLRGFDGSGGFLGPDVWRRGIAVFAMLRAQAPAAAPPSAGALLAVSPLLQSGSGRSWWALSLAVLHAAIAQPGVAAAVTASDSSIRDVDQRHAATLMVRCLRANAAADRHDDVWRVALHCARPEVAPLIAADARFASAAANAVAVARCQRQLLAPGCRWTDALEAYARLTAATPQRDAPAWCARERERARDTVADVMWSRQGCFSAAVDDILGREVS
jgi:hypothetical protein